MQGIISLTQLQRELGLAAGVDVDHLLHVISAAEDGITRVTGRRFTPRIAAIIHYPDTPTSVILDDDLLELSTITTSDGATLSPADVMLLPYNDQPASSIQLIDQTLYDAVTINGVWGWHDDYAAAWRNSGDTLGGDVLVVDNQLIVSDASAATVYGDAPRFQVGQLIRINTEIMQITAITAGTPDDTLTVRRAVNGSTLAAHGDGDLIDVYHPPADVVQAGLLWAAWLYRHADGNRHADGAVNAIPTAAIDRLQALIRYAF
jgi:hypothetical protein